MGTLTVQRKCIKHDIPMIFGSCSMCNHEKYGDIIDGEFTETSNKETKLIEKSKQSRAL
jgi:hypothetical protein